MGKMIWIFTDCASGESVAFDDEIKAKIFVKDYGNWCYDLYDEFPELGEDYTLRAVPLNLNFKEWDKGD